MINKNELIDKKLFKSCKGIVSKFLKKRLEYENKFLKKRSEYDKKFLQLMGIFLFVCFLTLFLFVCCSWFYYL